MTSNVNKTGTATEAIDGWAKCSV